MIAAFWAQVQFPLEIPIDVDMEIPPTNSSKFKDLFYRIRYPAVGYISGRICEAPGTKNWKTPAGFFRQVPTDNPIPCPSGFWCPSNSWNPIYCCTGFYCPTPDQIHICPQGMYCPMGSTTGQSCSNLARCDIGTDKPFRIGVLLILLIALFFILAIFKIKKHFESISNLKISNNLDIVHEEALSQPQSPSKLHDLTFDIAFDNLQFSLPDGTCIMKNVSGSFQCGTMTAIMGPSGAGKSTLFSLLTGKIKRSSGTILLNGFEDELSQYKKLLGFVPQDDIMLKMLTVNDILAHSAHMRLPTTMNEEQRTKQVIETINFLAIGGTINSVIGDEERRGISGGQRKRVNIGMEIVADPAILFLDEPTSGLDSSTALELVRLLCRLARESRMTIAAVIHSPSIQTFYEFDNVLFLIKGGIVAYFGPTTEIKNYFVNLGFECGHDINPADFAMDVVSGKINCRWDPGFIPKDLGKYWELHKNGIAINKQAPFISRNSFIINNQTYLERCIGWLTTKTTDLTAWGKDIYYEFKDTVATTIGFLTGRKHPVRETPNIFVCYKLLLIRAVKQQFKSEKQFIMDSAIHFVAGAVLSIAIQQFTYLGRQPQEVCDIAPVMLKQQCEFPLDFLTQAGMLASIGVFFSGQATAAFTFGNEKVVYWRDSSAGMPAISYFLAKFTADIPRILIASFFYTLGLIIFLDYRSNFGDLLLIYLGLYYVAFNFGYLISILFNKSSVALLAAANALFWSLVVGSVSPDMNQVNSKSPDNFYAPFRWLWTISGPRWAVEAFYIKEARARPWEELQLGSGIPLAHGYDGDTFITCIQMLFNIGTMWAFFSFVALKLSKRRKQK